MSEESGGAARRPREYPAFSAEPQRFSLQTAIRAIPGSPLAFREVPPSFYVAAAHDRIAISCPCAVGAVLIVRAGVRGEFPVECEACERLYLWDGRVCLAVGGPVRSPS